MAILFMLLVIVLAFGLAAQKWGIDTRDSLDSPEWERRHYWGASL